MSCSITYFCYFTALLLDSYMLLQLFYTQSMSIKVIKCSEEFNIKIKSRLSLRDNQGNNPVKFQQNRPKNASYTIKRDTALKSLYFSLLEIRRNLQ